MEQLEQNRKSRESDSREKAKRPMIWRAPETLPSPDPRPGWTPRWVRISTLGVADPGNISSKLREGYEPCKAEDYPELMMHASTEGRWKGNIEVGGLLLCRIPSEILESRMQQHDQKNKMQMESVDSNFLRDRDARSNMAMIVDKKSKVTFGSGT
jgi:hypothetical protein